MIDQNKEIKNVGRKKHVEKKVSSRDVGKFVCCCYRLSDHAKNCASKENKPHHSLLLQ